MARQEDRIIGRRLRSSYVSTVVSITLVLFVMGLLGLIILHASKLSGHVRESIAVSVFLDDRAGSTEIRRLQSALNNMPAVNETIYISREEAAEDLMQELGEDFISFLGYNPLPPSIVIHLRSGYANPDSITVFEQQIRQYPLITDVDYQQSLVHLVHENVQRIGIGLFIFSILLLTVSVALINNTIRLSVFSKRFLIKSMQLVGATQGFIRKPFIKKGIVQGVTGALIAISLLVAALYAGQRQIPGLVVLYDLHMLVLLFSMVLFLGIIISWISTYFAVKKYLKIKTDFLYYY